MTTHTLASLDLTEIFPDAECIAHTEIRVGDTIALWLDTHSATLAVVTTLDMIIPDGVTVLLVDRPVKPLPTEPGDMIRLHTGAYAGAVMVRSEDGRWMLGSAPMVITETVANDLGFDQVWITTENPDTRES